jgi:beta-glucanase (GH16 family)
MVKWLLAGLVVFGFLIGGPIGLTNATVARAQVVPFGVAPPAGQSWVNTFDDEMHGFDATKWTGEYGNGLQWCPGCPDQRQGLSFDSAGLNVAAKVNYSNFSDKSELAAENTGGATSTTAKFSQRYGYFEWYAETPHDLSGEGDGLWPALWALPIGKSNFPLGCQEGNEEADVLEIEEGTGNRNVVQFNLHDYCNGQYQVIYPTTSVGGLSQAYHHYGLYWRNDGSPHGSMQVYFDGQPQGSIFVLDPRSMLWDNGIYLLNDEMPCPAYNQAWGNGNPCSVATSSNNPIKVAYVRAFQLTGGTPVPTPTPGTQATACSVTEQSPASGAIASELPPCLLWSPRASRARESRPRAASSVRSLTLALRRSEVSLARFAISPRQRQTPGSLFR